MKKVLTSLLLLALFSINANAGKSLGKAHDFSQPDGTVITVRLLGDENFSWYQTLDGVLLTRVNNNFYIAEITGYGTMQSSGILAHNAQQRTSEETAKASEQNTTLFFSEDPSAKSKASFTTKATDNSKYFCPHSGNVKVPVILMNYTDLTFSLADKSTTTESKTDELKTIMDNYLNSTSKQSYTKNTRYDGYSSVKQYFYDASDGKLNFTFDIFGPYTTNNNHDYYGHNAGVAREKMLIQEALDKSNADIDFSQYDSNNDGNVDIVYVIFAGGGANTSGDNNDFWSKCYYGQSFQADGKTINVIGGSNEMLNYNPDVRAGVGPLCHEISHGLGLPDLYWSSSITPKDAQGYVDYNNCGPEYWDLMDGGLNIGYGIWPCQYAAWERDIMGWRNLVELTEPTDITMYPSNSEDLTKAVSYRVTNPENEDEYFTIEYIPSNKWSFYQYCQLGNGLIITHVYDYALGSDMLPNNVYGHPNITLVPADQFILAQYSEGKKIQYKGSIVTMPTDEANDNALEFTNNYFIPDMKGDPYPGSQSVTSVAAYKNYDGSEMAPAFAITDITKNDDGSISFKFRGGTPSSIDNAITDINCKDNRIFTIEGRYVGTSKAQLPAGMYIQNGKKVIIK